MIKLTGSERRALHVILDGQEKLTPEERFADFERTPAEERLHLLASLGLVQVTEAGIDALDAHEERKESEVTTIKAP